jgi:16S rRNA C967 or C1407 C5-methylase (RsmB/RsmF family)
VAKKDIPEVDLFQTHFLSVYGERWEALRTALSQPKKHVAFAPYFNLSYQRHPEISHVYWQSDFPPPMVMENGLKNYYLLDLASIYAPLLLSPMKGAKVLDMCAAPGGKSLVLSTLFDIELTVNELSRERRERLKKVLHDYLPAEKFNKIKISGYDAKKWGIHNPESFDYILLDAPCSSERHLIEKPHELKKWKIGRSKRLQTEQWTLLSSALLSLKKGGTLIYSTCSISPLENDGVIEKMLDKRDHVCVEKIELNIGEKTKWGHQFFPDTSAMGPLYICKIKKI